MILGTGPQLISNAEKPQLLDMVKGIGYGLVFAAVGLSTSTPAGAEYHFGTHQKAIYESQFKGVIFHSPHPNVPGDAVKFITGAPQQYDFTQQAQIQRADTLINQSSAIGAEFQFGLHQKALIDSQGGSRVFVPLWRPVNPGDLVPIRSIHVQGQELNRDLTLQGSFPFVPVASGWISTMVTAGPDLIDLTLQAEIQPSTILLIQAPWTPTTLISVMQADPWQRQAQVYKPSAHSVAPLLRTAIIAAPTPWDFTQSQGLIIRSPIPPPSKVVQPAQIYTPEQRYDNLYPLVITQPMIYVAPPPFTGFWVQAVTAGWYGGRFRTPGDIFLLAQAADFSDSTIDYQVNSNGIGFGWMTRTAQTVAYDWLQSNGYPALPPQDPLRRFVY